MPWVDSSLPFSGATSISRHCSHHGAEHVAGRATSQVIRYLALLKTRPQGATDLEAAELLGLERSSINARRVPLVKAGLVIADGWRKSPHGIKNTVWRLAK